MAAGGILVTSEVLGYTSMTVNRLASVGVAGDEGAYFGIVDDETGDPIESGSPYETYVDVRFVNNTNKPITMQNPDGQIGNIADPSSDIQLSVENDGGGALSITGESTFELAGLSPSDSAVLRIDNISDSDLTNVDIEITQAAFGSTSIQLTRSVDIDVGIASAGGQVQHLTIGGERYRRHVFRSDGSFTIDEQTDGDILLVGGGGGGAGNTSFSSAGGGGGGAGGLIFRDTFGISGGLHPITVGGGGNGINSAATPAENGADTEAFELKALGGGGGILGGGSDNEPANDGGSGGGARQEPAGEGLQPGSKDGGYGNDGAENADDAGGGGGGGAGEAPSDITGSNGGDGGDGRPYTHIFGDDVGDDGYFAGGGGGGADSSGSSGGSGGRGGGGDGALGSSNSDGMPHTGGGGGGGNQSTGGADGGSGIVIVRLGPL